MTDQIVQLLIAERDKLNRAIDALGGSAGKRRGRPPGTVNKKHAVASDVPKPQKRTLSAAGRKAIADAAKKRWAAIKAGKATSPFAKAKTKTAKKG
jgi:hypothetical protein